MPTNSFSSQETYFSFGRIMQPLSLLPVREEICTETRLSRRAVTPSDKIVSHLPVPTICRIKPVSFTSIFGVIIGVLLCMNIFSVSILVLIPYGKKTKGYFLKSDKRTF